MDAHPTPKSKPAPAPASPQPGLGAPVAIIPRGLAVTALILGIIAFAFGWLGIFSILGIGNVFTALAAIVFGIIALAKGQSKAMAITGLSLGVVGLISTAMLMVFFTSQYVELSNGLRDYHPSSSSSLPNKYE